MVAACHHPRMRSNAFQPLKSRKNYKSMSLFGLLRLNLLLALPCIRHKRESQVQFNVAKCDKIFDELLKNGNIKLPHTIPQIEELKKCVYCKWHGSFLHKTNDCNVFRRQIQSVVNEGRLRFQEMKIDRPYVHVDTLGPVDKKFLVRPCSADKGKGKNIIIGDPRMPNLSRGVVTRKAPDGRKANKTGGAEGHGKPDMPKFKSFGGEGCDKQKDKRSKVIF
jgi:hypothetical protein